MSCLAFTARWTWASMPCSLDSTRLKPLQAEGVLVDHVEDQLVAVIAGLDPVDLAGELVAELGDVLEVLEARLVGVGRHGKRIFRPFEIGRDHLDALVVEIGLADRIHGRHPVAEEDVDVLVLHRGVGDRHGQHLGRGLVAEAFQHARRERGGRRDVGPADIGEAHLLARRRIGSTRSDNCGKHDRDRRETGSNDSLLNHDLSSPWLAGLDRPHSTAS